MAGYNPNVTSALDCLIIIVKDCMIPMFFLNIYISSFLPD